MSTTAAADALTTGELTPQKQQLLLEFYKTAWNEMTWRRNAGYRTIILGFAYFGILLTQLSYRSPGLGLKLLLALVMLVGTLFGAGYLVSNYAKYMAAAAMTVKIEEYVGAYDADFLGTLGALMPESRRSRPRVPLTGDAVCFFSVIAFAAGGLLTAIAIFFV